MPLNEQIKSRIAAIRAQIDDLEQVLGNLAQPEADADFPVFDPDTDKPDVEPLVDGSRVQKDWCGLMLWAQLRAVNVRQRRGATHKESVAIAKRAGYRDGRGWGWGAGSTKDDNNDRWITDAGMKHLEHYYGEVGRTLPSDLA